MDLSTEKVRTLMIQSAWESPTSEHLCFLENVNSYFPVSVINTWDNHFLKRKGLFWLKIWSFSPFSWSLLVVVCEVRQHIVVEPSCSTSQWVWRERGGSIQGLVVPFESILPVTRRPAQHYLFRFPLCPSSNLGWVPSLLYMSLWEHLHKPKQPLFPDGWTYILIIISLTFCIIQAVQFSLIIWKYFKNIMLENYSDYTNYHY